MDIYVFTDDKKIENAFSVLQKIKNYTVTFKPYDEHRNTIKNLNNHEIVYIDIQKLADDTEIKKTLNYIMKYDKIRPGIIDTKNKLSGIAHYFHFGFCDYINMNDISQNITAQRINEILEYKQCASSDEADIGAQNSFQPDISWNDIIEGNDYTFFLMYLRLDRQTKLKTEYGYDFIEKMTEKLEKYIIHLASANNGKLWNWDVNNGIILFPYSDSIANIIIASYRFMRDSILLSSEVLNSPVKLDFTVILDKGRLEYHSRGMTGTTISESLNRIYHAADLMAEAGNLYVFDALFNDIPPQISHLFIPIQDFEGHNMKRLKRFNIR